MTISVMLVDMDLTTIQQPLFQAGKVGCETLLSMINQPDIELEEIILPVELIVRKTTAPPSR